MGVFRRLSFHLLLVSIGLAWLASSAVAKPSPYPPSQAEGKVRADLSCQGKHEGRVSDKSITRKYDPGVGFNPSQYTMQWYVSSPWRLAGDLAKEREKFRIDKLKEFIRERGTGIFDVPAALDLAERSGVSTAAQSGNAALSAAVRILEERAEVDCRTGDYVYSIEFLIPKNPLQLLSYPLRLALEDAVEKAVGQAFSGPVLKDVLAF